MGGDTGVNSMTALGNEMANVGEPGRGQRRRPRRGQADPKAGRPGRGQADATLTRINRPRQGPGGRLWQRQHRPGLLHRFSHQDDGRRASRLTFPGMIDGLVAHEGVGFVVVNNDDGTATVIGKHGTRNVHTGAITGVGSTPALRQGRRRHHRPARRATARASPISHTPAT